jgi:hypothetical protein
MAPYYVKNVETYRCMGIAYKNDWKTVFILKIRFMVRKEFSDVKCIVFSKNMKIHLILNAILLCSFS